MDAAQDLRQPPDTVYTRELTRQLLATAFGAYPGRTFIDTVIQQSPETLVLEEAERIWRRNAAALDRLRLVREPKGYATLHYALRDVAAGLVADPPKAWSMFADGRRAGLSSARNEILDYARDAGRTARSLVDKLRAPIKPEPPAVVISIRVAALPSPAQRITRLTRLCLEHFGTGALGQAGVDALPPLDVIAVSQSQAHAHHAAAVALRSELLERWRLRRSEQDARREIRRQLVALAAQVAPAGAINGDTPFATGFHVGCLTASKRLLAKAEELYPSALLGS
jgi:hypothetical protein